MRHYVDTEHRARRESQIRTEARIAELRALTPDEWFALYYRLREEYSGIAGVTQEACVRRSAIRRDLTLLEMFGREARAAAKRRRRTPSK